VAARVAGDPATALYEVDPAGGRVHPLGRFPADGRPPLALAIDPVGSDPILALDHPAGSRVVRLRLRGRRVVHQRVLGTVAGRVTALAVAAAGDIYLALDGAAGGLLRLPRGGGAARTLVAVPRATALFTFPYPSAHAFLAHSGQVGPPRRDPGLRLVALATGKVTLGPYTYTGYRPPGLTGLVDLPTGVPRQVFANEDGSISLSTAYAAPVKLALSPALPPGGTVAIRLASGLQVRMLVLGGRAHPWLKALRGYGSPQSWQMVAGPLPGDPVDFDLVPPAGPRVRSFGAGCAAGKPADTWITGGLTGGPPRPGNATFRLELHRGIPSAPALLALGDDDLRFAGFDLPLPTPGGCPLLVSILGLAAATTDGRGGAVALLPIPGDPALRGALFHGQWLQAGPGGVHSSGGATVRVY
jgi:hypothetical protein